MEDILKKFGATAYNPGEEIHLVIPTEKLLLLDKVVRGISKKGSKPA